MKFLFKNLFNREELVATGLTKTQLNLNRGDVVELEGINSPKEYYQIHAKMVKEGITAYAVISQNDWGESPDIDFWEQF